MKTQTNLFTALALLIVFGTGNAFAQDKQQIRKENRLERLKMEELMFRNPKTLKIPEGIREKELNYVYGSKAGLLPVFNESIQTLAVSPDTDFKIRGPFNVGGRTRALGIDARNTNIRMIGGASGGLYRSTDGGSSWTLVTEAQANPSITGIAQDPTSQDTWYYITGEAIGTVSTNVGGALYLGDGVYKSTDNGVTWNQLSSTDPASDVSLGNGSRAEWQFCHDIAIDPIDGDVLVANRDGIYRSTDGGTSWTLVLDAGTPFSNDITHLDVLKTGATTQVYYAGTHSSGSNKGFFTSTDGQTWNKITDPASMPSSWERIEVAIAPSNSDIVWFFLSNLSNEYKLYKYDASGPTWTDRSANLPAVGGSVGDLDTQGSYNMVMHVKPDDENYIFLAGTSLYRSSDGFTTALNSGNTGNTRWIGGYSPDNNVSRYANHHPDVHSMLFIPGSNIAVVCGHDGGVSETTDITADNGTPIGNTTPHPVTWTELNNGYYTTQAYSIAIDPSTSGDNRIMLGFQDNGNWLVDNTSATAAWGEEVGGGDGSYNAIVAGEDTRYHSTQNGSVVRVTGTNPSNPTTANHVHPSVATNQLFVNPFLLDKNDQKIMYYPAGTKLWRHNDVSSINTGFDFGGTDDAGWNELTSATISSGKISALDVSKSTANVLYYGTSVGKVYKIADAHTGTAPTRTDITGSGFPSGFVSSVSVDDTDANKVFVTFSNYGVVSIFYSEDGGSNWTNVSGNLEEFVDGTGNGPSIRWITIHNLLNGGYEYYVGASTGLYSTQILNGTSTIWTQESTDVIGNVPVSMIRARTIDGLVAVGTHGKGAFSASNRVGTAPTVESFSPANGATQVAVNSNLSITFNENVVVGTGNIVIRNNADDSSVESFAADASAVSISGSTVTIDPTSDFAEDTQLYVEIDAGAFKNGVGGNFAGITGNSTWSFSTVTTASIPTASTLNPANGATEIDVAADLSITFNEDVVAGTGNIVIKRNSDDSSVETFAADASTVSISGSTVTINPTNDLPEETQLYVEIDAGAFESGSGGDFAGISGNATWSFTTAAIVLNVADAFGDALQFYPNPATHSVSVSLEKLNLRLAKVEIYDIDGRMVAEKLLRPQGGNDLEAEIDVRGLSGGSYIMKVITPERIVSRTLIIK